MCQTVFSLILPSPLHSYSWISHNSVHLLSNLLPPQLLREATNMSSSVNTILSTPLFSQSRSLPLLDSVSHLCRSLVLARSFARSLSLSSNRSLVLAPPTLTVMYKWYRARSGIEPVTHSLFPLLSYAARGSQACNPFEVVTPHHLMRAHSFALASALFAPPVFSPPCLSLLGLSFLLRCTASLASLCCHHKSGCS